RKGTSSSSRTFAKDFPKACELIVSKLGPRPFHLRGPLNASALDSVMSVLISNLKAIPENLATRYEELKNDEAFTNATYYGTSDVSVLKVRFQRAKELLI